MVVVVRIRWSKGLVALHLSDMLSVMFPCQRKVSPSQFECIYGTDLSFEVDTDFEMTVKVTRVIVGMRGRHLMDAKQGSTYRTIAVAAIP